MRINTALLLLSLLISVPATSAERVQVLASIKPLQLIAADIVGDTGEVALLLSPGASPHHYAMKPSDMRKLQSAGLVTWVGPEMEQFLVKPLGRLQAPVLPMMTEEPEHDDGAHEEHGAHDGHHHEEDLHLWLDPLVARDFARRLATALAARYPESAATLTANLQHFEADIAALDKQLQAELQPLKSQGFFVFHDAWGHFVAHYGLNQLGAFTVDPGRKPGARHLAEIRNQLEAGKAVCVFSEPQFQPALIGAVTADLKINRGEIDPLATEIAPGPGGYSRFLQQVAQQFVSCLSPD